MEYNENEYQAHQPEQKPEPQGTQEPAPFGGSEYGQSTYRYVPGSQPEFEEPPYQPPYRRKQSPFADSPYVMEHEIPQKPPKTRKRNGTGRKVLAAVLALVVLAGSCVGTMLIVNNRWEERLEAETFRYEEKLEALEDQMNALQSGAVTIPANPVANAEGYYSPAQVYAMNVASVVQIQSTVTSTMFGQTTSGISSGSGVIISEEGYVLTNYHVVNGATSVSVIAHDKQTYEAQMVGYDENNDVALLKVEAQGLQAAKLGSSDALMVGDQVVAIGYPLSGSTASQTVGYISAKNRSVTNDNYAIDMLQTDAAINSGNSGGPLFNMYGEVVGITTSKYSGTTSSGATIEGFGFAIPMDDITEMLQDLIDYGYVKGPFLGIYVKEMDAQSAAYYGMPVGAYVDEVMEGHCAQKAGMQAKDIIVAVEGQEVTGINTLDKALRKLEPGDTVTITVFRGGREIELEVTLDERPAEETQQAEPTLPEGVSPEGMPEDGDFEDWFNYLKPFFGQG